MYIMYVFYMWCVLFNGIISIKYAYLHSWGAFHMLRSKFMLISDINW